MSDFDFSLNSADVKVLFCDFRKMDVLLKKHRDGIDVMDSRDIENLKQKRWHFHQVMMTLHLMDAYRDWLKDMGIS